MTNKEYRNYVFSDLCRYVGEENVSFKSFLKNYMFNPGFKYMYIIRKINRISSKSKLYLPILIWYKLRLRHFSFKYGFQISAKTKIGYGFYIGHFGNVIINAEAVIGNNCNISQEVTIGQSNRGKNKGTAIIGDNVYIGPGAKIVGGVKIGNNVAIGANCVVTCDCPDNSVVVGIPSRIISDKGSEGYVNRKYIIPDIDNATLQ